MYILCSMKIQQQYSLRPVLCVVMLYVNKTFFSCSVVGYFIVYDLCNVISRNIIKLRRDARVTVV